MKISVHYAGESWREGNEKLVINAVIAAHMNRHAGVGIPEGMFYLGYRAHGDVLYCPDCVETWKERNGAEYDEQYKDAQHLFAVWWNRQVQMQITDKSKIRTYSRNCVGDFVEVEG